MNIKKLQKIDQKFYKVTASDFDSTRQYFWQGWNNLIQYFENFNQLKLLDLGSGNSRFYQFLKKNFPDKNIDYMGIDNNDDLLNFAQNNFGKNNNNFKLQNSDLISSLMKKEDFIKENTFDVIVSFGVFHHIPSFKLRLELLNYLKSKISHNGFIVISLWQFMDYARFRKKIANHSQLEKLGLKNLEKNDYILDWNRGKKAYRYCHFIDTDEQNKLVKQSKLNVVDSFRADGKERDVNQYFVLQKY